MKTDLSGKIAGTLKVYKFTRTTIFGAIEKVIYIPIFSIAAELPNGSVAYRHFSINNDKEIWEDPSYRWKAQSELAPKKEWIYYLYNFNTEHDARIEFSLKFIQFKNGYEDIAIECVDTENITFKENKNDKDS